MDDQCDDAKDEREDVWTSLTRSKCRGMLVDTCFYDMDIMAAAWQPMYDQYSNSWRALPMSWFRQWVEQGLLIKDEGYEVEKALGVARWRDTDLYTLTEKGLAQYREQFSQGKRYL